MVVLASTPQAVGLGCRLSRPFEAGGLCAAARSRFIARMPREGRRRSLLGPNRRRRRRPRRGLCACLCIPSRSGSRIQTSAQPLAAFGFMDAALERVPGAFRVGGGGLGLAEQVAEVEEVLLAGAALGERDGLPLLDEFVRSHPAKLRRRGAAEERTVIITRAGVAGKQLG